MSRSRAAGPTRQVGMKRFIGEASLETRDVLAVEEPLEIRLAHPGPERPEPRSLAITLRPAVTAECLFCSAARLSARS